MDASYLAGKSAGRIREDHVKLRVGGAQRIAAAHAHSADVQAFHRRTYHLVAVEGGTDEGDALWLSLVHYRVCEPREDASRKIRRERGRAQQLAAEEVERQIAQADLDDCCCEAGLSDEVLANAVSELLGGSDESPQAARVAEGAVDAFTGLAVPAVKLEKEQPLGVEASPPRDIPSIKTPCRVVDAAPRFVSLAGGDLLVALDGHVLFDPLTRLPNEALGLRSGDGFGVRFAFAPASDVVDVAARAVNACALKCAAPKRARAGRASMQVLVLRDGTSRVLSPESSIAVAWGSSNCAEEGRRSEPASTATRPKIAPGEDSTKLRIDVAQLCSASAAVALPTKHGHDGLSLDLSGKPSSSVEHERSKRSSLGGAPTPCPAIYDDETLASLPEAELDEAVERLVLRVVAQMSRLARNNADLADELDTPDRHGFGLLHYCALYNLSSVIAELLALGASPDGRPGCATTPLHLAAAAGHAGVVSALLEGGADASTLDAASRTPHDCAVERGHFKVASLLEDYHADELRVSPRARHEPGYVVALQSIKRLRRDFEHGQGEDICDPGSWMADATLSATTCASIRDCPRPISVADFGSRASPELQVDPATLDEGSTSEINKALLHTAFASLSLREKCALSIAEPEIAANMAPAQAPCALTAEAPVEVTSVISDCDKESLDVAMSLMDASELRELEDEARVITANVRSWIVRRNYIKVREAARTLETRWILRKRSSDLSQASVDSPRSERLSSASEDQPPLHGGAAGRGAAAFPKQPRRHDFVKLQAAGRGM